MLLNSARDVSSGICEVPGSELMFVSSTESGQSMLYSSVYKRKEIVKHDSERIVTNRHVRSARWGLHEWLSIGNFMN